MEGPVYSCRAVCGKTHQKGLGFGLLFLYRQFIKVSGEPIYQSHKYRKKSIHQNIKKIHKHSKIQRKAGQSLSENKLEKLFFQ